MDTIQKIIGLQMWQYSLGCNKFEIAQFKTLTIVNQTKKMQLEYNLQAARPKKSRK